jgi:hypothetical protein
MTVRSVKAARLTVISLPPSPNRGSRNFCAVNSKSDPGDAPATPDEVD